MSTTEGVDNATVEQPTEAVAAAEEPVKEKKRRAPKEKKPKIAKTASHPPYFQMIKEALLALNEKGGSSPYAIAKYMEEKHKAVLPANFRKILGLQLKNSAARGKLIKIRASYKLSESGKKEKITAKPVSKKTKSINQTSDKAKKPAKKVAPPRKSKRSTPAKPKQPKSIKSGGAKKAKKATA
ncbi:histone H1 [Cornus florida]|uniref:histone H1 n=1 Tax=Cornus florida TaxID=4283 RepID=UPI00289A67ED|nr:histone H1 [Cornus florida]